MFAVSAFDLETCNVENQIYCEPYAASVYHLNSLRECFNDDLKEKELQMERENVLVPDPENNNPVLHMIEYVINNYKGKPKIIINKHGKKMIWSYKYQFVGHNASGFDNYIVLKSIPKSYTSVKIKKYREDSEGLVSEPDLLTKMKKNFGNMLNSFVRNVIY